MKVRTLDIEEIITKANHNAIRVAEIAMDQQRHFIELAATPGYKPPAPIDFLAVYTAAWAEMVQNIAYVGEALALDAAAKARAEAAQDVADDKASGADVGFEEAPAKGKRTRRTKAEMEAARLVDSMLEDADAPADGE